MNTYPARQRGFTLVELMIAIAIIGILASLAIYGLGRLIGASKSTEAVNNVGTISRAILLASENAREKSEVIPLGQVSLPGINPWCPDCPSFTTCGPVPAAIPQGTKYQPKIGTGDDFEACCWSCISFGLQDPIHYQYSYHHAGDFEGPALGCPDPGPNGFEAVAKGDVDGDGTNSTFTLPVRVIGRTLSRATQVCTIKSEE